MHRAETAVEVVLLMSVCKVQALLWFSARPMLLRYLHSMLFRLLEAMENPSARSILAAITLRLK
ncbi:hypothetical protein A9J41_14580 [Laribacter hongkongensis]|nr:hypothetical protein [Laribacter hongkongensis]